jgi:hypothetical protein
VKTSTQRLLLAAVLTAATPAALAAFSGPYDVSNWTTTLTGDPAGGGGSVDTSGAPTSVQILGGDAGCDQILAGFCMVDYTIAAAAAGTVAFDWAYETADEDPSYDFFGVLLNGVFTQLTANGGPLSQSGSLSFAVAAGDIFGFRLDCTDCSFGAATVVISNFSGPVAQPPTPGLPEPGPLALVSTGLGLLALSRRRRLC